jgi:hypothetical protein
MQMPPPGCVLPCGRGLEEEEEEEEEEEAL